MKPSIAERFAALPRARKGTTKVVIVEESVLAELIGDAQVAEAALVACARPMPTYAEPKVITSTPAGEVVVNFFDAPPPVVPALPDFGRPRRSKAW